MEKETERKLKEFVPDFFDSEIARARVHSLKDLILSENKHYLETRNYKEMPMSHGLEYFLKRRYEGKALLEKSIKNSTLIDLGCGPPNSKIVARNILDILEPGSYIGIDKYLEGEIRRKNPKKKGNKYEKLSELGNNFLG